MQRAMKLCIRWKRPGGEQMRQKKERGRFTIKLNENDPAHEKAIRLLESQRPHSKAQFVVAALLHYEENRAAVEGKEPAIDRAGIEAIVRDILKQAKAAPPAAEQEDNLSADTEKHNPALALISDTLSAFRGG